MKKGDTLYMHIYNLNDGVFQTIPAVVNMVGETIIHVKSKIADEHGTEKHRLHRLGRILPGSFGIVGKNESTNELIVYSESEDAIPVKQAMTEYLIKQKNQETVSYENKMRTLDNLIIGLENTIELETERE